jgi:hypothetical protein
MTVLISDEHAFARVPFAVFTDDGPECAYLFPLSDTRRTTALAVGDFDDFHLRYRVILHRYVGALCVERFAELWAVMKIKNCSDV